MQTGRPSDRHTDIDGQYILVHTYRQAGRQADMRQAGSKQGIHTDGQQHKGRHTYSQSYRHTYIHTYKHPDSQADKHTQTVRGRHTYIHTY